MICMQHLWTKFIYTDSSTHFNIPNRGINFMYDQLGHFSRFWKLDWLYKWMTICWKIQNVTTKNILGQSSASKKVTESIIWTLQHATLRQKQTMVFLILHCVNTPVHGFTSTLSIIFIWIFAYFYLFDWFLMLHPRIFHLYATSQHYDGRKLVSAQGKPATIHT